MVNISDNIIGTDFDAVFRPGTVQAHPPFKTGTTVHGDNGKQYMYAKANAAIAANNAAVNLRLQFSTGEYVAANSGGNSRNDTGQALASGDFAWFTLA